MRPSISSWSDKHFKKKSMGSAPALSRASRTCLTFGRSRLECETNIHAVEVCFILPSPNVCRRTKIDYVGSSRIVLRVPCIDGTTTAKIIPTLAGQAARSGCCCCSGEGGTDGSAGRSKGGWGASGSGLDGEVADQPRPEPSPSRASVVLRDCAGLTRVGRPPRPQCEEVQKSTVQGNGFMPSMTNKAPRQLSPVLAV
jgi:hypothetical protein